MKNPTDAGYGDINMDTLNPEDYDDADEVADLIRRAQRTAEKERQYLELKASAIPQRVTTPQQTSRVADTTQGKALPTLEVPVQEEHHEVPSVESGSKE